MFPSTHLNREAIGYMPIDWANTEIPDDIMYRMLQADERFYEYVRNGELRFEEDHSQNMFLAKRIHSGIRSLFDVQKDKPPYATINESDYLESTRSMWQYIVNNPRIVAAFNPHFLFSEEVEVLKAAIWKSPDRSMRQNELQDSAIRAVNQSEDVDFNDFNLIDEILSDTKEYKQRVRTRKQKSTRMFSKALDVYSKALALWGGFYCFRMEFGLNIYSDDRFNQHQAIRDRNEFLKHARDCSVFPEHTKYIWFLSYHQQKGFTHHFYILCDPNYVHNPDDMIDRIGRCWSETMMCVEFTV